MGHTSTQSGQTICYVLLLQCFKGLSTKITSQSTACFLVWVCVHACTVHFSTVLQKRTSEYFLVNVSALLALPMVDASFY